MKTVKLNFKGETYSLIYNAVAMFELSGQLNGDWTRRISKQSPEGFSTLAKAAEIMSTYGAAVRSDMGFSGSKTLTIDKTLRVTVQEYLDIHKAVCTAVTLGMEREIVDEDEEVDLVLQEIQKKTDKTK
ncbi:MAG: hypothetical protein RSC76_07425 [Oscillospiraceae bacterium]